MEKNIDLENHNCANNDGDCRCKCFIAGQEAERRKQKELYSPEEILQAMFNVLLKHKKIYMDLVLTELKNIYNITK